jgi:hypothetical protein
MKIKMRKTVPVAANEHGSATTRFIAGQKYEGDKPWQTALFTTLIDAGLADRVLPADPEIQAGKAVEAAPENKALDAAPENKTEDDPSPRRRGRQAKEAEPSEPAGEAV